MSHYLLLIVGENPEEQLKPFDANKEVKHIISREELIQSSKDHIEAYEKGESWQSWLKEREKYKKMGKQEYVDRIEKNFLEELKWTDEEHLNHIHKRYDKELINKDGSVISTYNPKSKWDWYQIGGRWQGILKLKKGKTGENGTLPLHYTDHVIAEGTADKALKGDIDWEDERLKDFIPSAILKDNEWHEDDNNEYWDDLYDKKFKTKFEKKYEEIFNSIKDDELITIIDCHI